MTRARRCTLALAAVVLACALARADQLLPVPSPPIVLRLDGTIYATAEAARGKGFTVESLGFTRRNAEERRWLAVEVARTVGPDQALDGKDVLAWAAPLQPNFVVMGAAPLVDPLVAAESGTKVRMEGLVIRGSRTWFLRAARVGPDAWEESR